MWPPDAGPAGVSAKPRVETCPERQALEPSWTRGRKGPARPRGRRHGTATESVLSRVRLRRTGTNAESPEATFRSFPGPGAQRGLPPGRRDGGVSKAAWKRPGYGPR